MTKKASTPALRFKGFTYTWEQRRLGEVLSLIKDGTHGTHQDVEDGPLLLSAKNIKHGEIRWDNTDRRIAQADYEKIHSTFSLENGDILLTIVGSIGEVAILRNSDGITFQRSVAFLRPNKELKSEFLYAEVLSEHFQKELDNRKSTSAQPGIYLGDLGEIPFTFPKDIAEQKQIGTYFRNLDRLITLHQRKYDKLTNMKKSMLEKMFPKNGANVPEIRFKGFTDAWEQRKLKELATFAKGTGYSKSDLTEQGTPIILYGRLYTKYETKINDVDTFAIAKKSSVYSTGNEVIVPASGETAEDIARASYVAKSGFLLGGDLNIIYPIDRIEPTFLALSISNGEQQKSLAQKAQGKSVVHIHNSDLESIKISYPKMEEQEKIGRYFLNLDRLITLHQRELEKLKNLKKACLEKMFV